MIFYGGAVRPSSGWRDLKQAAAILTAAPVKRALEIVLSHFSLEWLRKRRALCGSEAMQCLRKTRRTMMTCLKNSGESKTAQITKKTYKAGRNNNKNGGGDGNGIENVVRDVQGR